MKKQQFIQELTAALAQVDAHVRSEIIADISEHFTEGASCGLSEEEICIKLGQPGQIAEQVLEEYNAIKGQSGAYTSAPQIAAEATRVRGGYEMNYDQIFPHADNIEISLSISNLRMVTNPQGNDIRVTIQGRTKHNTFEVDNKNGRLVINQRQPFITFELFNFRSSAEVTVYVPASFAGDITAKTTVSNVTITGIGGSLQISSTVGNVNISGHKGNKAYVRSSAGNINLTGCDISQIDASSAVGNINVDCQETHNLTLISSAGEVKAQAAKLSGDTNLSSSAGNVRLEAREVQGNITAKSSAGSVKMYLPKNVNCRIDIKKSFITSVTNNLIGNPESQYVLRASTGVGAIALNPL